MPKRLRRRSLPVVLFVLFGVGAAFASPSAITVKAVTNTSLGTKIIANSGGFTLYHYMAERKKGSIGCTGACKTIWPPLLVGASAKPIAGAGLLASKLGTIKRPDGGVQVTYNGFALYRYAADKKAGQVVGQGVEGSWFAVTPAGTVTRATATTSSSTGSTGSTSGSSSSGGSSTDPAYNY